ncbi:MAG: transporter substrate-binding domain-containing protein [Mangrovicoccus sp.]|nr:transporter substrate-binding domain-containing protein [Mangrovicoccus sp.]
MRGNLGWALGGLGLVVVLGIILSWSLLHDPAPEQTPIATLPEMEIEGEGAQLLDLALAPWQGDLDGAIERGFLRVAIPVSLPTLYLDGSERRGASAELVEEFGRYLAANIPGAEELQVMILPTSRSLVLELLAEGRADMAAGLITATEARAARFDFSPPFRSDVAELIVTAEDHPAAQSLEDLVGLTLHVRPATSFWDRVTALNAARAAQGKPVFQMVAADPGLRSEDMLDLVASGSFEAIVADSPFAQAYAAQRPHEIRLHEAVPLAEGGSYVWVHRKNSPQLAKAVAGYMEIAAKGTLLGNVILNRYVQDAHWLDKAEAGAGESRLDEVEPLFRKYGETYGFDWLLLAAQGYQESGLDHDSVSHRGAVGIMQVMPNTAKDPAVDVADFQTLEGNIQAAARYLAHMRERLQDEPGIGDEDRMLLSLAAYNAGPANLIRARNRADQMGLDRDRWFDNVEIAMAAQVSQEPVRYVRNILKYYVAFRLARAEAEL